MKQKVKLLLMVIGVVITSLFIGGCGNSEKNDKEEIVKAEKVSIEDFFKNPEKSGYKISPDGKYYSYLAPYEKRMNIFVQEIGKEEVIQLTKETERDIAGYFWANDNRILFLKDSDGDENYKLLGVNIDGSNLIPLTDFAGVRTRIIDDLKDIPNEMIVGLNKNNPRVFDPYRLNIETGDIEQIAENPGNIQGWMTDHDGQLRIAYQLDGLNTSILYRETEKDEFKVILTTNYKEQMAPSFFTFDNKNLYCVSNLNRDKTAVVIFDIEKGEETEVLYENADYDVGGLSYSRKRKVITTAYFTSWKKERHFFDKEVKKLMENLEKHLGEYEIGISGMTKDETKFIVRTYSDRSLGAYYFYDKANDELTKIHDVSPWIDENNMAEVTPISYKSRDGLTINGYLTLPKGYTIETAKNLPTVIHPHGGPWHRDKWGFDKRVQFLANRGYAVLQMNFRGSTGYGKKFMQASFKQWGLTMQDDITDGVNWLIEKGIADKERIGIMGGSYGGYAVLAGLTFTPEVYACGVDIVGVSNLFTFMKTIPPYWKPMLAMMYDMVGDPVADSVQLYETSPVFHVDKIIAPLYIAQGAKDPRVNVNESEQVVEALKNRGVDVEYMVKENEGHGFRNEENKIELWIAMEKFLAKYLLTETEAEEIE